MEFNRHEIVGVLGNGKMSGSEGCNEIGDDWACLDFITRLSSIIISKTVGHPLESEFEEQFDIWERFIYLLYNFTISLYHYMTI